MQIVEYLDTHNGSLMVIVTFIYVMATIAICVANLQSAKATREQLAEAKRQYEEEHRAFISYEFIYVNRAWYGLRFTNLGKRVATNAQICLNKEFIENITESGFKQHLYSLEGKEFTLGIGQSYDIFFGSDDFRGRANLIPIQGEISYNDRFGSYTNSFFIDFSKYPPIFSVTSDGEKMENAVKKINKSLTNIAEELKKINRNLNIQRQVDIEKTGNNADAPVAN